MSRSFKEIQEQILEAKAAASELNALEILTTAEQTLSSATSTSKVSVWRLWVYVFSFVIWSHEKISEKNATVSRPQNQPNFKQSILDYYDGLDLIWKEGSFQYDLTNVPDAESRKIIARCAVLEPDSGGLVVKIATDNNGVLGPVTAEQKTRIEAYIKKKKVPGVPFVLFNKTADLIKVSLTVYVNPLVIDTTTGKLLSSTEDVYPIKDAIELYLANLEFDGAFVKDFFRTTLKDAEGIELVVIDLIQSKFDAYPFTDMAEWKTPDSGYFKINDENLTINYLPYVLANS
ncbi:hypothetical protein [Flavobacterium maritimum]|uniref:hypothetical protein n=1 Tax=Flavobacterium maritimum TaxID=3149042 RepID=UPI0032B6007A